MKMATTWSGALALAALISLPLQAAEPVKVGSKIDTEGALLGNMIQQVLESHGVKTINKIQLGTTPVVRGAIVAGELDIYRNIPAMAPSSSKMKTTRRGRMPNRAMRR